MEVSRFGVTSQALFPVELWSQIFEEAAFIPGLLDTEILDPFESGEGTPLTLYPSRTAVKLSLRTIHALMLTCRSWYNIALPLLYRFIFIENQTQAATVRSTLRASQEQAQASPEGTTVSLGARVLHLMLCFNRNDASVAGSSAFWNDLLKIVQSLPNLQILSGINRLTSEMARDLSREFHHREDLCTTLIRSCKHSLRRLSFDGDADMIVHPYFRSTFVSDFLRLQTITGGGSILNCANAISGNETVTTLTVDSTAEACYTPHDPARASFPAASTAILRLTAAHPPTTSWLNPFTTSWQHFLTAHGAQLHTIHLDLRATSLPALRALFTQWCPQLATLHLAVRHSEDLHAAPRLPPALTRLSVYVDVPDGQHAAACVLGAAAAIAAPAPALTVLRFANADLAPALRAHVQSGGGAVAKFTAGVRLEDSRGRSLRW